MNTYTTNAFGMPVNATILDMPIRHMAKRLAKLSTLFVSLQEQAEKGESVIPNLHKTMQEAPSLMLDVLKDQDRVADANILWHFLNELDDALDLMFPGSEEKAGLATVTKEWLEAFAPSLDPTEVTWMMMHHFLEVTRQNTQLTFSLEHAPRYVTRDIIGLAHACQNATMWLNGRGVPDNSLTNDFVQELSLAVESLEQAGCEVDFSLSTVR